MNTLDKQFATRLGLLGLIPFVLLTLLCWIVHPDWMGYFIQAQLIYGLAIMAFLGGLHWGLALLSKGQERQAKEIKQDLLWGILPVVVAWFAMSNMFAGFVIQMVAFIFSYQYDKRMYQRFDLPDWFVQLRFRLTCVVVTTQVFTFLAANIRL
ncbi:MAG: DUF3429 domain-containing protein [Undibacterium sp.]|nr:DUF3429 domain-containing protein [Undibacterium sp.]